MIWHLYSGEYFLHKLKHSLPKRHHLLRKHLEKPTGQRNWTNQSTTQYSHRLVSYKATRNRLAENHLVLFAFLILFVGYSSYLMDVYNIYLPNMIFLNIESHMISKLFLM